MLLVVYTVSRSGAKWYISITKLSMKANSKGKLRNCGICLSERIT